MNFHAFGAAALPRRDSNSRKRHFQTRCQENAQRFVRAVIDRRRGEPNLQSILVLADDFVAARSRLHANRKADCPVFLSDQHGELRLSSRPEQSCSNSYFGCALFDGDLEILGHAH